MNHTDTGVIILNPTAGRERAPRYLPHLQEVLSRRYASVITRITEKPGDACDFAREAAEKGFDIFCMGGDGTINEVVSGMVSVPESPSVFGFVPFGTVNDLARALHIPRSPRGAIRMLETAVETKIDVGKINGRYFINIVAAGLIPEAVSQVSIKEKTLFGSLAYFIKAFQALPRQKAYRFLLEMENGATIRMTSPLMAAMLTDSAGSFRNLLPPEDRNKGAIKLAFFHDFGWLHLLRQGPMLLAGMQMGEDFLTVINVKKAHVSIIGEDPLGTNVDGDKGPDFPITLEILPDRLPIFVPREDPGDYIHYPRALQYMKTHLRKIMEERLESIQLLQHPREDEESTRMPSLFSYLKELTREEKPPAPSSEKEK